jgi:hypothetical protein
VRAFQHEVDNKRKETVTIADEFMETLEGIMCHYL